MALHRTAVLIISTLVAGHLSYHLLKPLIIPPTNTPTSPHPEKPVYWEKPQPADDHPDKS